LFDADRGALLTEVALAVARRFGVRMQQLHNDSTSISMCGQYRSASGRSVRHQRALAITYGYSRDHRPDLKQLLFILTTDADGGVPVHFRCADGNTTDVRTHIETWNTLRALTGRADFLYVADSKLCSFDNMRHIADAGGRFVTVMPRSRQEDAQFRKWVQTNSPAWELVWDRPNARDADGPRDLWYVFKPELASAELYGIVWVWSTLLSLHQTHRRQKHLAAATEQLTELKRRLAGARARLRGAAQIDLQVAQILERYSVGRYLKVSRVVREEHTFKQEHRGRPGPDTAYRRVTRKRYDIEWVTDDQAIAYDKKSDGMYPLLTNDRSLTPTQVLTAHKGQPRIEKRFEQLKTVHETRARVPQERGTHRSLVHRVLPGADGASTHRARITPGHARRRYRAVAAVPRGSRLPAPHHGTHPAPVQPGRARLGAGARRGRPCVPAAAHRTATARAQLAGSAGLSLRRPDLKQTSAAAEIRFY